MEANQYTLLFANCEPDLEVSMNVQSVMYNLNPRTHRLDFLSAGKTPLPAIYFSLFLVYLIFVPLTDAIAHCHRLKLADLGSAECFHESELMSGVVATTYYVAPEVLAGRDYSKKVVNSVSPAA
nr:protein GPR107-like [Ipomoea batatas]